MRRYCMLLGLTLMLAFGAAPALAQGTERPVAPEDEPIQQSRPSGFWGSTKPAVGGAYRWRLLGIGVVLALGTGFMMWRVVRRAKAERAARLS